MPVARGHSHAKNWHDLQSQNFFIRFSSTAFLEKVPSEKGTVNFQSDQVVVDRCLDAQESSVLDSPFHVLAVVGQHPAESRLLTFSFRAVCIQSTFLQRWAIPYFGEPANFS